MYLALVLIMLAYGWCGRQIRENNQIIKQFPRLSKAESWLIRIMPVTFIAWAAGIPLVLVVSWRNLTVGVFLSLVFTLIMGLFVWIGREAIKNFRREIDRMNRHYK